MVATVSDLQLSSAAEARLTEHLVDEEKTLGGMLEAVRALHDSLRHLDGEALTKALQGESAALKEAEELQTKRLRVRTDVAVELGVPLDEFTLSMLSRHTTGDLHSSIVASRQKLATIAAEMDKLNRQNAAMIYQSLTLMRGIVGRLTNAAGSGESYNAGGVREEAHIGSLMQWGG